MKRITHLTLIAFSVLLAACNKTGKPGGGNPTGGDILYPATLSFYEGSNSGYPSVSTFKYDDKKHLTYYGNHDRYTNIGGNGVQLVVFGSSDTTIWNYLFAGDITSIAGATEVHSNYTYKTKYSSTTGPVSTYLFTGMGGLPNTKGSYNGGTYTQFYTFDANGDVSFTNFVTNAVGSPNSSSYDPGGLDYDHVTFKNYDNHPSPYSAIVGYKWAAYPWSYPWQMYFAHSLHNPTEIIEESLNTNTMKWAVYSKSELTYTYNDQGYPSEVRISTTYPSTGTPNQVFFQSHTFTYTK